MRWIGAIGAGLVLVAMPAGCGGGAAPVPAPPRAAWVMVGDSLTAQAFAADTPGFVNAGQPGAMAADAVARLPGLLEANPDAAGVALAYGTNDALQGNTPSAFQTMLGAAIDKARAAGKAVRLARVPWGRAAGLDRVPAFNEAVRALEAEKGLAAGPDLYAWFEAHPDQLGADGIHPTADGEAAIRRLWAEALGR